MPFAAMAHTLTASYDQMKYVCDEEQLQSCEENLRVCSRKLQALVRVA